MAMQTYKIGDLAAMFNLTVRTIRYYEDLGLLKSKSRQEGVHRRYSERNIVYLKRISQLKGYGLSLAEIKEFFALAKRDRTGESCRALLVSKYADRITAQEAARNEAQRRIDELRWHIRQLQSGGDFFECPGKQCVQCEFKDTCEMKAGDSEEE
jgi:MerR family transcriptional regulator, copper efflux regulator